MTEKQASERRNYRLELEEREFLLLIEVQALFQRRNRTLVSLNALMRGLIDAHFAAWGGEPDEDAVGAISNIQLGSSKWMRNSADTSLNLTLHSPAFEKFASIKSALERIYERPFSVKDTVIYLASACIGQFEQSS